MDLKLKAFLDLIAWSEGTSTHPLTKNNGYDVIVTGVDGQHVFTDYTDHPYANGDSVVVRAKPLLLSTAAGRYQLLARYWRTYRANLGLPDFSPASQDAVALQQIKERAAVVKVITGDVAGAVQACANIWASFPGNSYGQGGHALPALIKRYAELLTASQ